MVQLTCESGCKQVHYKLAPFLIDLVEDTGMQLPIQSVPYHLGLCICYCVETSWKVVGYYIVRCSETCTIARSPWQDGWEMEMLSLPCGWGDKLPMCWPCRGTLSRGVEGLSWRIGVLRRQLGSPYNWCNRKFRLETRVPLWLHPFRLLPNPKLRHLKLSLFIQLVRATRLRWFHRFTWYFHHSSSSLS